MFCGLNGATLQPAARERAAQAGDQRALARAGGGALDHQRAARSVESFGAIHRGIAILAAQRLCRASRPSTATVAGVTLDAPAQRIVSLAPHVTEQLFAAGAGAKLVGVSEYSDYPEAAKAPAARRELRRGEPRDGARAQARPGGRVAARGDRRGAGAPRVARRAGVLQRAAPPRADSGHDRGARRARRHRRRRQAARGVAARRSWRASRPPIAASGQ